MQQKVNAVSYKIMVLLTFNSPNFIMFIHQHCNCGWAHQVCVLCVHTFA